VSCGAGKPNFRLLDSYLGWGTLDPDKPSPSNLAGFEDPEGIRLALEDPAAVNPADVNGRLLPARLAKGCSACEWYLSASCPGFSGVLLRNSCSLNWKPLWMHRRGEKLPAENPIAVWRDFLAISYPSANLVEIWSRDGGRRISTITVLGPGPITFTAKGELLVTVEAEKRTARYGLDGKLRGWWKALLHGKPNRIAVDGQERLWIVTVSQQNVWELWAAAASEDEFTPGDIDELRSAFPPSGLAAESGLGFCFDQPDATGFEASTCFSWCGDPLESGKIQPPSPPNRKTKGQLITGPLDSGLPRCRWHRVRLEAVVPPRTSLEVAVAALEEPPANDQGDPSRDSAWSAFPAGAPHPLDWTVLAAGATDALIDQPPGRYLYVRLRFSGDGFATPVVRRVRLDFPRVTSLEYLPEVYRENPQAGDFTERFLSLFDSSVSDLDRVIERYPALLDPTGVPEQLLPWLAGFFGIALDPTWDEERRRRILQKVPEIYRLRGTPEGLRLALNAVFDVVPAIEELSPIGSWGAVGNRKQICFAMKTKETPPSSVRRTARIGGVRLFGKARVRFRIGHSGLCAAPLRSYGNPDLDPFAEGAYRFRVLVPPLPDNSKEEQQRLINLINAQKPAHTVASVRVGGTGFHVGFSSVVGIDSVFVPFARPVLGKSGNIRLRRNSIVWRGSSSVGEGTLVGQSSLVGIQTIAG
jgi:phage tail-like protein